MKELIKEINQFREERDWRQFHNSKDLAISISIEAAELLENFQWKTSEAAVLTNKENIEQEIADVLIYSLMMASDLQMDVPQMIRRKLELNRKKYPIEQSKGRNNKYTEL